MKRKLQKIGYGILLAYVVLMSGYNFVFLPIVVPAIGQLMIAALSGRDDGAEIFDSKFILSNYAGTYEFYFEPNYQVPNSGIHTLLHDVITYSVGEDQTNEYFFATSEDGCVVLDKNTLTCRIYLYDGIENFDWEEHGYIDLYGISQYEQIVYLSSFEEFSKGEQDYLTEMIENPEWVFQEIRPGHYEKVKQGKKRRN